MLKCECQLSLAGEYKIVYPSLVVTCSLPGGDIHNAWSGGRVERYDYRSFRAFVIAESDLSRARPHFCPD